MLRLFGRKQHTPLELFLLNNYIPAPSKHLKQMVNEFQYYLKTHLEKLKKKEEVERFKYYVKKRINLYLKLLKSREDKNTLSHYAMLLVNEIAKKLDSELTKIYRYIRRGRNENAEKYIQRSKVSRNTSPNLNDNPITPSLKEITMRHLKSYLAKIPPKNNQELLAFKDLFKHRMKEEDLETLVRNVNNIENIISYRIPNYMSLTKKRGKKTFTKVQKNAGRKIGSASKKFLDKKREKARLEEAIKRDKRDEIERNMVQNATIQNARQSVPHRSGVQVQTMRRSPTGVQVQTMRRSPTGVQVQTMRRSPTGVQVQTMRRSPNGSPRNPSSDSVGTFKSFLKRLVP